MEVYENILTFDGPTEEIKACLNTVLNEKDEVDFSRIINIPFDALNLPDVPAINNLMAFVYDSLVGAIREKTKQALFESKLAGRSYYDRILGEMSIMRQMSKDEIDELTDYFIADIDGDPMHALEYGRLCLNNIIMFVVPTKAAWRLQHWGTPENAYETTLEHQLRFLTNDGHALPVLHTLSKCFPNLGMVYEGCGDRYDNCYRFVLQNGTSHNLTHTIGDKNIFAQSVWRHYDL